MRSIAAYLLGNLGPPGAPCGARCQRWEKGLKRVLALRATPHFIIIIIITGSVDEAWGRVGGRGDGGRDLPHERPQKGRRILYYLFGFLMGSQGASKGNNFALWRGYQGRLSYDRRVAQWFG